MLPLTISYNYEIIYHRQKERESLKSPFPCCFDRFFSFLHFLMAYFSTKSEYKLRYLIGLKEQFYVVQKGLRQKESCRFCHLAVIFYSSWCLLTYKLSFLLCKRLAFILMSSTSRAAILSLSSLSSDSV